MRRRLRGWLQMPLFGYMAACAPSEGECAALLATLQRHGRCSVAQLLAGVPAARRETLERGLVWLAKLGLLSIEPQARRPASPDDDKP